jgi:hypothetical protein
LSSSQPNQSVIRRLAAYRRLEWLTGWLWLLISAIFFLLATLVWRLALPILGWWAALVAFFLPALPFAVLLRSWRVHAGKRRTTSAQKDVPVLPEGKWVSNKMVDHYRHLLDEDEVVHLITRFHFAKLLAQLAGATGEEVKWELVIPAMKLLGKILAILAILAAFFYAWVEGPLPVEVPLTVAFLLIVSIWYETIEWRYTVFILTNKKVRIAFRAPLLVTPIMTGYLKTLVLRDVQTYDKDDSWLANFLGLDFAQLIIDSPSDKDKPFNDLYFMKRPEWVFSLVDTLVDQAKKISIKLGPTEEVELVQGSDA